jgi:hypothetical protein
MTATTIDTTTARPVARARVGWGDLLWLTWRQHRWTVGATAALAGAVSALALGMAWHVEATGHVEHSLLFDEYDYLLLARALAFTPVLAGVVIAAFWAAPLLAREYEQRTHLVVWTQDVSPVRWLAGKVVLLGAAAAGLSAGLAGAVVVLMNSVNAHSVDGPEFWPFGGDAFEAVPHVQVGYALFGFALGLALSAFVRRTVPAMALAFGAFFVVRGLVASLWRPRYAAPERMVSPFDPLPYAGQGRQWPDESSLVVEIGYLDAAGRELGDTPCVATRVAEDFTRCLADHGVVRNYVDHQPVDRVLTFQLVELGIFTALAAALLALTFRWVKRKHRV